MIFYRSWQAVAALSFDLDDTLYDNAPHIARAEQWLFERLKTLPECANLTQHDWLNYKRRVLALQPNLANDVSAWRESWLRLGLSELGLAHSHALAAQLVREFVAVRSDFRVSEQVIDLLKTLRQRYHLVAITNGNVDMQRIGLSECFDLCLYAGQNGMRAKPASDLFVHAAQTLNLPPQVIGHIGDHVRSDVSGAVCAGYRAIWFNPSQQSNTRLRQLPDLEIHQLSSLLSLKARKA